MSFTQLEGARGVRRDGNTDNYIPSSVAIKPIHDRILVQPLDVTYSRLIQVIYRTQPVRGLILACGPGHYPIRYIWKTDDRTGKRFKVAAIHSGIRRPIKVKPGDIIELGGTHDTPDGVGRRGYTWESFYWGDRFVIWATERDVCGITGHQPLPADLSEYLDQRPASERPGVSGRELSGQHAGPAMGTRA